MPISPKMRDAILIPLVAAAVGSFIGNWNGAAVTAQKLEVSLDAMTETVKDIKTEIVGFRATFTAFSNEQAKTTERVNSLQRRVEALEHD